MQLTQLRHAIALAEEGSFSAAAQRVNLTQSAFSRSIQALEDSLQQKLFDRSPRGVSLTSAGALLLPRARALTRQASALMRDAGLMSEGAMGSVAIGCGPMFASLSRALAQRCWLERPAVFASFHILPIARMTGMLVREELDFYIADTRAAAGDTELIAEPVADIKVGYHVRPGHPLTGRRKLAMEDVVQYPLASPHFGELRSNEAGLRGWSGHLASEELDLLIDIATNSDAVLMSNFHAIADKIENGSLIPLDIPELDPWISNVAIVRLADVPLTPAARHYAEQARALFAS